MNQIPEIQLELTQLKRLAAQRQLYSDAKIIHTVQVVLNVFGPPILAVFVKCFSMRPVYAACCGITLTFLNILWFTPWQQSLKKKASDIQELFDCDVLKLDWREIVVGHRLEVETVEEYALKHRRKDPNYFKLKKWYPENVGKLPLHLGRIICQRSNCWWSIQLRRHYAKLVIWILAILLVFALFFGIKGNFTLEEFILTVIIPLIPAFVLGIQQYQEHTKSATRLDKLRKYAEGLFDKGLKGAIPEELIHASRDLQNEICNHRRTSPSIFDWLYNLRRKKDEDIMNKATDELVNRALESLKE